MVTLNTHYQSGGLKLVDVALPAVCDSTALGLFGGDVECGLESGTGIMVTKSAAGIALYQEMGVQPEIGIQEIAVYTDYDWANG